MQYFCAPANANFPTYLCVLLWVRDVYEIALVQEQRAHA